MQHLSPASSLQDGRKQRIANLRPMRQGGRAWPSTLLRLHPVFRTRNRRKLHIRLIRPADAPLLIDLFYSLSPESKRRRFHYAVDHATPQRVLEESERLADVDNLTTGGAVLATERTRKGERTHTGERARAGERIVGVARLMRNPETPESPEAEAAVVVRDDYHGTGVGGELLRRLVLLARRMKVRTIIADIEADNYAALRAFRNMGLPTRSDTTHGETRLYLSVPD